MALPARRKARGTSLTLARVLPFGSLAGLGALATADGHLILAGALGAGALFAGRRLFDRRRNERRELQRRVRESVAALSAAAREDRSAASQMSRLASLQDGVIQAWEMLPDEYEPLLLEDLHTVIDEVEAAAVLARRRGALRKHLAATNRRTVEGRVRELEAEVAGLAEGTELRMRFEAALEGRRGELRSLEEVPRAVSAINAQIEGVEGLLGNLRADLLALDADPGARYSGPAQLAGIKERVAYFKRGLEEVSQRSLRDEPLAGEASLDDPLTGSLPAR
jgi:hypothetical protein